MGALLRRFVKRVLTIAAVCALWKLLQARRQKKLLPPRPTLLGTGITNVKQVIPVAARQSSIESAVKPLNSFSQCEDESLKQLHDVTVHEVGTLINLAYPHGAGSIPNAELYALLGEFWNALEMLSKNASDFELLSSESWAVTIIEECEDEGHFEANNIKQACAALDRGDALPLSVVARLFQNLFEKCPVVIKASQALEQNISEFVGAAMSESRVLAFSRMCSSC